jgi:glycosyltransferase involved in cell wall biosynthesis
MPTVLVAHPSPDLYGSDRQVLESIKGMRAAGWTVAVCLPSHGPLVGLLGDAEVSVRPFTVLRKSLLSPIGLLRLLATAPRDLRNHIRLIRGVRPDALYVNTLTLPLWILAGRLTHTPVLVHVHEAEEDIAVLLRIVLNAPLFLAHSVVANSEVSRRVLLDVLPGLDGRTVVIPNGISDGGAEPLDRAIPGRIALVARLSPRKGVDVAIEAIASLREQGRDVRLDICGTAYVGYEWFEQQLRARADEPGLAGSVCFLGYINPTEPVLAAASIVLVPSRVEPFGNTAVEGLLSGRPVIASAVQGLAEILTDGQTGLLVPAGDVRALAGAIARLMDDPDLAARLAERGRSEAVRRYAIDRYQNEVNAAIVSIARNYSAQPGPGPH